MTTETLKKIEDFINKQQKFSIIFTDPDIIKGISLENFINSFHYGDISRLNNTYQDGTPLKKGGGRRSLVDTIIACRETLGVSVDDVLQVFRKAYQERKLVGWYCKDIKRFVFRIGWAQWSLSTTDNHGSMNVHNGTLDAEVNVTFNDIFENAEN